MGAAFEGSSDDAELDRVEATYAPLAEAVRDLIDATIQTRADEEGILQARAVIEAVTQSLRREQSRPCEVSYRGDARPIPLANAVIGQCNPIVPPVVVHHDPDAADGRCWPEFVLGAAYEGPPGLVHGGAPRHLRKRTHEDPGVGPVGERLPSPLPVLGIGVGGLQGLQVDHVVRDPDAVIAQLVGGLGDLDDLRGVEEGAADVELHGTSRAQAGLMKTPSACAVTPSASDRNPRAKALTPSVRSTQASQRSGPSGVPRRYFTVMVPVNRGWVRPWLAASPSR